LYRIAVFPGDGIGREVVTEAIGVLEVVRRKYGIDFSFDEGLVGGAAIDEYGTPLPEESLKLAKESHAILLGAVGGPKWDSVSYEIRPERALLELRSELNLFANLRPAKIFEPLLDASTLKREVVEGIDILVVRELTGGVYFGKPKGIEKMHNGMERGINTMIYTTPEIERIAKIAFDISMRRRKKVTSVDKANILESSVLWRNVVNQVHMDYPDVELNHMLVDNCAMQLIRHPKQFDVILTTNLFGDILSDEAAMLTGSIGMLPSASLGGKIGMYEPVHGSAPDIQGKNMANPIATILSAALMLEFSFNLANAARDIERAVVSALKKGYRTADIYQQGTKMIGTSEMGEIIRKELEKE